MVQSLAFAILFAAGAAAGIFARLLPASGAAALLLAAVPPVAAYFALGAC